MILLVDDDPSILEMISTFLRKEGHVVQSVSSGRDALQASETEPDLIISDVMMEEMDGFEFLKEYCRRFPHRLTPFLFLSSLTDHYSVVLGLDIGADDYLTKPVHLDILRAKVRSVLNRKTRYTSPVFYGDISRFCFMKVLQFCERKALTGEIVVASPTVHTRLQVRGGSLMVPANEDATRFLTQLYDLSEGTFVVHAQPVDFRELESASMQAAAVPTGRERPVGRLSAIRVESRLFQVQTEMGYAPRAQISTIVTVDGRVVMKRESMPPEGTALQALDKLIETQHAAVEREVRERLHPDFIKKAKERETKNELFGSLVDTGYHRFTEKDYHGALADWQEASTINPEDKTISLNLRVVKAKLGLH